MMLEALVVVKIYFQDYGEANVINNMITTYCLKLGI